MTRCVAYAVLAGCLAWSPLAAQPAVRVHLGSDVTRAGEMARISVTLDDAGEPVAALVDELAFPSALSFVEGELGEAGSAASATLETEMIEAAADGATRRLRVTVKSTGDRTLASGTVAVLTFKVPDEIETDSMDFRLDHRASITVGGRGDADGTGDRGLVTVLKEAPAVIACFFYMH